MKKIGIGLGFLIFGGSAMASTGDTTFNDMSSKIHDWTNGSLGRIIAGEALVGGMGYAIVRQNLMAAVIAVSAAFILSYGPDVLLSIFTITV